MDDEEEDMSRPISQLWGTPFRDIKYEEQATQMAGQALAVVPTSQSHNNNSLGSGRPSCGLHWQPHVPFQGKEGGGRKLGTSWELIGNHPERTGVIKVQLRSEPVSALSFLLGF